MRWGEVQQQQPRLGQLAQDRLIAPGVLLVVTIRRDGTPRLSPVEPFVLDGELWLSMMLGSRKAADLHRDEVTFLRYDNATGDQHLVLWPPGRETVRRGTSATTVGEPVAVREILL